MNLFHKLNTIRKMRYIKNYAELSVNRHRQDALDILEAGLEAINTEKVVRSKIKVTKNTIFVADEPFLLSEYENIKFVGIGKCSLEAGRVIENMLKEKITEGIVIDTAKGNLKYIKSLVGTHPLPSEQNIVATEKLVEMLKASTEKDLIITVISGGGSALLCLPYKLDCDSLKNINLALTKKGADIYELNTVRKHLSKIKGGQMAKIAYPAKIISLIFSDVLGDDISVIASGPTVKDKTTKKDAEDILIKYDLLTKEIEDSLTETPKEDKWFEKVSNFLTVTNSDAIDAMKGVAENLGYETILGSKVVSGEADKVGENFAKEILLPGQVKISGGETTVTIRGGGEGGRNQEVALGALKHIRDGVVFISASSDGIDNTNVAGVIVDSETRKKAEKLSLDPDRFLLDNNSYGFFSRVDEQIITGPTGSNVSDLYILLSYKK